MSVRSIKSPALSCAAVLASLMMSAVHAADGQIEFTGVVNDNACTINSQSVTQSVDMGQVRIADFPNTVGALATTGSKPFSIALENCSGPTMRNATVKFSGQQAASDATVLGMVGSNQVAGLGIQIADARTGAKLPLNTDSTAYTLRPASNTFDFTASYVRLVADTVTDGEVTTRGIGTGQVNAVASFDITYR
ncbi:MAG: type 1 fimbrial protein [Sphingobacteriales bacterium]|uniref:fimbrial protein n=2 Tax=Pseudomonas plecoglossicida TaxID=70775 RepID=UPI0010D4697E|nr:type 1 fimbrial protein [Pseudomonas plecoglossicida]RYD98021.1 MAG: type 1 fimbrial protein [Sphingobacteriales bacterium]